MNQPKTKNKVIDYLQMSSQQYEDRLFTTYWNWCYKYANQDQSITQQLISDAALNRWFIIQYNALENEFIKVVEAFPYKLREASKEYYHHVSNIHSLFPKPLIAGKKANYEFKTVYQFTPNPFLIHAN